MMQQTHTTLSNGLQSFADVSPDYALAPVGIGSFKEQADKLAEYGRNGDVYVVHAAEGETVVPIEVLEANPKVKELLFGQMREMGLDPGEFIVGNELNSINPATGMPEFFFKKIFRAVKKAVKKVVSFAKKAAPVILPLAAAAFGIPGLPAQFFGAGKFGAAFLGSGIGSLASGKSLKNSFKDALISGGITSLAGGLTGAMGYGPTGAKGFEGFKQGLGHTVGIGGYPTPDWRTQGKRFGEIFTGNDKVGSAKDFLFATPEGQEAAYLQTADPSLRADIYSGGTGENVKGGMADDFMAAWDADKGVLRSGRQLSPWAEASVESGGKTVFGTPAEDIIRKAAKDKIYKEAATRGISDATVFEAAQKAGKEAVAAAQPTMLQQWGPAAAIGAGAAYGLGAFDTPPVEEVTEDMLTGYGQDTGVELYRTAMAKDPKTYQVEKFWADAPGMPKYNPYATSIPPIATAATGGLASFPRRDGAINGPGTERSDDIPAMLSDGEFVMTSKAVRGAAKKPTGNPETDRRNGAKNMYAMMRNFEMRA
jgi:hypothetical protein